MHQPIWSLTPACSSSRLIITASRPARSGLLSEQPNIDIIMFMTQKALDRSMSSKGCSIGADAGGVVISIGAGGDYDSETSKRSVRGFVFGEKGFLADLPLEGSKVNKIEEQLSGFIA
jgi:lipid-binding SYLF domain-containing protein